MAPGPSAEYGFDADYFDTYAFYGEPAPFPVAYEPGTDDLVPIRTGKVVYILAFATGNDVVPKPVPTNGLAVVVSNLNGNVFTYKVRRINDSSEMHY